MSAANTHSYVSEQAKQMSDLQRSLMTRASERHTIVLDRHEIPAAMGLERRGLARTHRPMKSLLSGKPVKGSKRSMRLTVDGRAVAKHVDAPSVTVVPLDLDECRELLRELAESILDAGDGTRSRNLARAAIERLRGEA